MKKIYLLILTCILSMANGLAAKEAPSKAKFLFLAGSARKDSVNKKLAQEAFAIAKAAGVHATFVDLKDYPMPMYDGDLEDTKGLPKKALELKKIFAAHDGVFIASPEYNASIPPLLKNTLDWISRPSTKAEPVLVAYKNKVIVLTAASPGPGGGRHVLLALDTMLNILGVKVIPEQLGITKAYGKFDKHGKLTDAEDLATLKKVVADLIQVTSNLKQAA